MAEYPITVASVPSTACYPSTPQSLLNSLAEYITVRIDDEKQVYIVSATAPDAVNQDKPWFQTYSGGGGYGLPKVVRLYSNGEWKEFAQLKQGDMILVEANKAVNSPWGESGYTYSFGDTGIANYVPSVLPTAPEGFKYKVYVGYWTTKS
jgi:hypothetical protein